MGNNEESREMYNDYYPSLNDDSSTNKDNNLNQSFNNQSSTIETNQPQIQTTFSYVKGDTGIMKEHFFRNEKTIEKRESITKIANRIIKSEPFSLGHNFYEKKIIAKLNLKDCLKEKNNSNTSENNIYPTQNQNNDKKAYIRPLPQMKSKNNSNNKKDNSSPKTNSDDKNDKNSEMENITETNSDSQNNPHTSSRNNKIKTRKTLVASESYRCKKILLNGIDTNQNGPNTQRHRSPDNEKIRRRTIIRGEEVKNVQITHIICSSKPTNFHITEKLETKNIKANLMQLAKKDKEKLKKGGKSSFTSSCKEVKPITQNLKGKTTIYQHARGIGMTNDKRRNINPLFYNSEIIKLDAIVKEKEKEKIEHIENFRSNKYRSGNKNLLITSGNVKDKKQNISDYQYKGINTNVSKKNINNKKNKIRKGINEINKENIDFLNEKVIVDSKI